MKVSYFKTQWLRILFGFVALAISVSYLFSPAPDLSTIEGVNEANSLCFGAVGWIISAAVWFILSVLSWHEDCIKELEKRVSELETKAVTDIEEVESNHFVVKRKLGPDKIT